MSASCAELGDPCGAPLPLAEAVVRAARLRPGEAAGLPQVHHTCPVVYPDFPSSPITGTVLRCDHKASGGVPAPLHLEHNHWINRNNTAALQISDPVCRVCTVCEDYELGKVAPCMVHGSNQVVFYQA